MIETEMKKAAMQRQYDVSGTQTTRHEDMLPDGGPLSCPRGRIRKSIRLSNEVFNCCPVDGNQVNESTGRPVSERYVVSGRIQTKQSR